MYWRLFSFCILMLKMPPNHRKSILLRTRSRFAQVQQQCPRLQRMPGFSTDIWHHERHYALSYGYKSLDQTFGRT